MLEQVVRHQPTVLAAYNTTVAFDRLKRLLATRVRRRAVEKKSEDKISDDVLKQITAGIALNKKGPFL
jgi:hypothetical protein